MKCLNFLLKTRWEVNAFTDYTATGPEDALRKILAERKKELVLRGIRWSDLRRLNRDDRFKETISRTVDNKTYTLEPGSYRYTFPVPDDEIQQSRIPQNPGWED